MELLFVYGTLREPAIQKKIFGRIIPGSPGVLHGYKISSKEFTDGIYPVIFPQEMDIVKGMVLEVTSSELSNCDEYEGDGYTRFKVTLESGKTAWVYTDVAFG
ncbi:MAG: gamma-glutamylcyclotransferase [Fibrobacter sp.]|nr:gamma-glutamylcyclotransferase [Fibrobacter sp.]